MSVILGLGEVQELGLLKHWYSSDVFSEAFDFSVQRMPMSELDATCLSTLREDVLYLFTSE